MRTAFLQQISKLCISAATKASDKLAGHYQLNLFLAKTANCAVGTPSAESGHGQQRCRLLRGYYGKT